MRSVAPATCGVISIRARSNNGLLAPPGLDFSTSSPAADIWPVFTKSYRAFSSISDPRAILTRMAPLHSLHRCSVDEILVLLAGPGSYHTSSASATAVCNCSDENAFTSAGARSGWWSVASIRIPKGRNRSTSNLPMLPRPTIHTVLPLNAGVMPSEPAESSRRRTTWWRCLDAPGRHPPKV